MSGELTWAGYLDWLVGSVGTLTAVAERVAAERRYREDVGSIERALRRLRARGNAAGGKWGARLLQLFGMPDAVVRRVRFMGGYHSRFTDLPVPICEDLIRQWDRPPTTDSRSLHAWLLLARANVDLRRDDATSASEHLSQVELLLGGGDGEVDREAQVERLLVAAFIASRHDVGRVASLLDEIEPVFPKISPSDERACLFARFVDQRAYELHRRAPQGEETLQAAEALYLSIPTDDAPPFALCRRANGLAFVHHRRGDGARATELAQQAATFAGDGGHVRLRAMALAMLGRVAVDPELRRSARARALEISRRLDDELLRLRFDRKSPKPT